MNSRLCRYAAIGFYVVALALGAQALYNGNGGVKVAAAACLLLGIICTIGIFTVGLAKAEEPDEAEWSDSIR